MDARTAAHAALVALLVEKGIITHDEYKQKVIEMLALQKPPVPKSKMN